MKKRGQVAMEFLMTYGWALIIIVVAIAALFFLNVFSTNSTTACTLEAPFACKELIILDNAILLNIQSPSDGISKVESFSINGQECSKITGKDLEQSKVNTVRCLGIDLNVEEQVAVNFEVSNRKAGSNFDQVYEGKATGDARFGSYVYDSDPTLLAAYDFQGDLNDISTNSNNLIPMNNPDCNVGGQIGLGCELDGSTSYFEITNPNLDIDDSDFTIALWANLNSFVDIPGEKPSINNNPNIISHRDSTSNSAKGWMLNYNKNNNKISFVMGDGTTFSDYTSENTLESLGWKTDEWHQIVIVNDRDRANVIWFDGELNRESGTPPPTYSISNTGPFSIGKKPLTENNYFNGKIDEVAVFKRALSDDEVKELYLRTK